MNTSHEFGKLFSRDLKKLKEEILSYRNEEDLWVLDGDIKNTAGNLAMHLCGNLQHFIGAVLAKSGYVRDRDFEFSGRKSKSAIIDEIDTTIKVLGTYFEKVDPKEFEQEYPLEVLGYKITTFYFIIHLSGHLNYHLGQINYHRRIVIK